MKSKHVDFFPSPMAMNRKEELSITEKVDAALVAFVYSQTVIGLAASLFCATIIVIGLVDTANEKLLFGWYSIFIVVTILRFILTRVYTSSWYSEKSIRFWKNMLILSTFISGALWGMTGTVLFPLDNINQQLLIVFILAGTSAGAVPLFSGILAASAAFLIPALLPAIINLFYHHMYLLFNLTITIYLLYLIILSKKMYQTVRAAISLQFENRTLLVNLSEAKNQLEIINKKLEEIATHDPLTNVANRNLFSTYFYEAIATAKENKRILALLYLDLDNFKMINDTYGHHIGDQLLLLFVDRLEEFFGTIDVVARLGGDEFAIILENVLDPNEVAKIARRMCYTLSQPMIINQQEIKTTVSIGIAIYPLDGDSIDKLLTIADKAMYYVKQHGGNNFRFNVTLIAD